MGHALSWIAFKGTTLEAGLSSLGLSRTGTVREWGRKSVTGHALPDGWHLVIAPRCNHPLVSEANLAALSGAAEVIACCVEEHVMFSVAESWRHGERVWRVEHDAQLSRRHLKSDGLLPAFYTQVLQQAQELQDAEDSGRQEVDFYFDVPLQMAYGIAPFKHDEENPALDDTQFEVYAAVSDPFGGGGTRKWWQMWKRG